MARRRILIIAVVVVVVAAAVAAVGASGASKGSVVKSRSTQLGTVLVNNKSVTLYLFEKDKHGKSACSGACADNWPPLITKGKPRAGGKVVASKLGTTKRSAGRKQVTYNGHPVYTFAGDAGQPGSTSGEGLKAFGAEWYVVGTNGKKIEDEG